jgi:hypothetical protein
LLEERRRLDELRNQKFQFIESSMASHRIDEVTEYNCSFLSANERRNTKSQIEHNRKSSNFIGSGDAVPEVDEEEESDRSRKNDRRGGKSPKFGNGLLDTPDAFALSKKILEMPGHYDYDEEDEVL